MKLELLRLQNWDMDNQLPGTVHNCFDGDDDALQRRRLDGLLQLRPLLQQDLDVEMLPLLHEL